MKEDGGRLRRSTDGVTVPAKNLDVTFPFHGKLVDLHLLRKDELSANVPVYTTNERGVISRQYIQDKNVSYYTNVTLNYKQKKTVLVWSK